MMTLDRAGLDYYGTADGWETVEAALRDAGLDPEQLTVDDLAMLDEFHAVGRAGTLALAALAQVQPGERVLDLGAGIGGPSRVLAERYDARVTAFDATANFCDVNERLTRATGLADRIEVVRGDVRELPFADGSFDVVWMAALAQNIPEKDRVFGEAFRVLAPGGQLAIFELVKVGDEPISYPVPWADEASQSHVVDTPTLQGILTAAGFERETWQEGTEVQEAIGAAAGAMGPLPDHGLSLGVLMPQHDARMAGLAQNVQAQRIGIVLALLRRPAA